MKATLRSFSMFVRQIQSDSLLYIICFLPILIAVIFRCGIPVLETQLCLWFSASAILSGYYLLFDLFLAAFTPFFLVFISAMVMLTDIDENIAAYLAVTPVNKNGYLVSRFLYPALFSLLISTALLSAAALTPWTLPRILLACTLCVVMCLPIAMMVVVFSHNRVEGMALAKLSGLFMFGLPAPFFLNTGLQYLFFWLPSFWIAKLFTDQNYWLILPCAVVSAGWIFLLYKRFMRKLL